ncbi:hypothetical protein AMJ82_03760 [candidate division TA06 bacterium SM23_40]|jgi:hypothetical protein|uniref:GON domain-containing protein n=1 Tax=candidate division TA06 bacterium SM23_40 TaxID=1703774 RepID=A0A0S8GEC6_UNCT6|nr:MAG: hypothetical protein AMJ82_03760 [candidate division TA06 bacterium SM23_40]
MISPEEAKDLTAYCGAYCGECAIYGGRIIVQVATQLKALIEAADYLEWVPKFGGIDFEFAEFYRGLPYFTESTSGCYCQEPCREGGGAPCKVRPCAKERGVEICYACRVFPVNISHGFWKRILVSERIIRDSRDSGWKNGQDSMRREPREDMLTVQASTTSGQRLMRLSGAETIRC